jgi:pimeloyl-ACP methyl ester carboxylesterase
MQRKPIHFYADGLRLDGDLYLPDGYRPDGPDGPLPAVVTASGYTGLKDIHPARFARALTVAGYACLAFDYRGHGYSEGQRGRLVPQEQVEDVRAAVSFLASRPEVDAQRIGVIGWALGGGVVIAEAADDPRVAAVVTCNALGDGERSIRPQHDSESWSRLQGYLEQDRTERSRTGRSRTVPPFHIVRLDLDPVTDGYVGEELYKTPGYVSADVTVDSAEAYLRFRPEDAVHRIAPRPLLLIHGADNHLHSPEESRRLYEAAGEPKELLLLEGAGHTEYMFDEHPTFQLIAKTVREFLDTSLRARATTG